jgi:hypothetical protein
MLPLVEIPEIGRHDAPFFTSVFSPEVFEQFQRDVSGLIVSENKTVHGINRMFVIDVRNQSRLKRLLTESPCSVDALNEARLTLLSQLAGTQMESRGVLSIDDTLLTHYGKQFDKIAYLYDSTQGCYVWAHNLVNLHDSDDQTDDPVSFRLWEPVEIETLEAGLKAAGISIQERQYARKASAPKKWRHDLLHVWRRHQHKPEVQQLYDSTLRLAQQLLTQFFDKHHDLDLPVTFANWSTQPACCRLLDKTFKIAYVGTLAGTDQVLFAAGTTDVEAFAAHLKEEHRQALKLGTTPVFRNITIPYKGARATPDSYCKSHHIHHFGKQRLVINHRHADLSEAAAFFISNRLHWHAHGITRIRRHRWPVEVYHEAGKADGLDQYQVRDFQAIYRPIALVAVTDSVLRAAQHDHVLLHKLQRHIKTTLDGSAGSCRRLTQAQALGAWATFIATALSQGQTLSEVMQPFVAAVCY